jgi:acyl-CoA hydrolase
VTHDPGRLNASGAFFAVNSALEIDELGNVNAQGFGADLTGGIGGMPDFAAAASRSPHGLSVIALPSERNGRSTLVEQLSAPVSVPRSLVEVVVTEHGIADLRGLADAERADALRALWPVTVLR